MAPRTLRTLRFLTTWIRRDGPVDEREIVVCAHGERLPTTFLQRRGGPRPAPTWILLHGITRPGRFHGTLLRFGRALAAAGARVLIPEIREWADLRLAPERTVPVVRACVEHLEAEGDTAGRPGLAGFSFGAPHAVLASTDPALRGRIGGVLGFGGYHDLERTVRFQFTGEHEWRGRCERLKPDPYGRWIVAANYLAAVPGHEDAGPVEDALWRLATTAGDEQVPADDPRFDPVKERLRGELSARLRPLFDLVARPPGLEPDPADARELASAIVQAARRETPALEVRSSLRPACVPVELLHGRDDRLIPYTEAFRLREAISSDDAEVNVTITGLFAHSQESAIRMGLDAVHEAWRFVGALWRVLALG